MASIQELPEEILLKIFKNVEFAVRRSIVPLVCKEWYQLTGRTTSLWDCVALDDEAEDKVFRTLQRAGVFGMLYGDRAIIGRTAVLHWFKKHCSVISKVTLADRFEATRSSFCEFGGGGLLGALIGVKDTLVHLDVDLQWIHSHHIPAEIIWLSNLTYLRLSNFPNGSLLEGLSCLSKLQTLKIDGNDYFELPESFFELTQLRFLRLSSFIEAKFELFSKLVCLTRLELDNVGDWGQQIANELGKLPGLAQLSMISSFVNVFPNLEQLTNVTLLDISGNRLTDFPKVFSGIVSLNVGCNRLACLPDVSHLSCLKVLMCYGNNFTIFPVGILTGLAGSIEELHFGHCSAMEISEFVVELTCLPRLRWLCIRGYNMSPEGVVGMIRLVDALRSDGVEVAVNAKTKHIFAASLKGAGKLGRTVQISL